MRKLEIEIRKHEGTFTGDARIDGRRLHGLKRAPEAEFKRWVELTAGDFAAIAASGTVANDDAKPCPACHASGVPLPVEKYRCPEAGCDVDTYLP